MERGRAAGGLMEEGWTGRGVAGESFRRRWVEEMDLRGRAKLQYETLHMSTLY